MYLINYLPSLMFFTHYRTWHTLVLILIPVSILKSTPLVVVLSKHLLVLMFSPHFSLLLLLLLQLCWVSSSCPSTPYPSHLTLCHGRLALADHINGLLSSLASNWVQSMLLAGDRRQEEEWGQGIFSSLLLSCWIPMDWLLLLTQVHSVP